MSGPTLRIHGYPVSNYFNICRAALIEKELAHEVVITRASQGEAFLAVSPMGKIPILECVDGWIGETIAIIEYLDDRFPGKSLRPDDPGRRATARQIMNIVQVYVEAPARSLFPGVFGGGINSAVAVSAARAMLDRATTALAHLMRPAPYLFGPAPVAADLFAFYNLDLVDRLTRFVFGRSIIAELGVAEWHDRMADCPSGHIVLADFKRYFTQYLADHRAAYRPGTTQDD